MERKHLLLLMSYDLYWIADFFYVIFYAKIVFMVVTGKVDITWEDKYGTTILVESIRHGLLKRLENLKSTCWEQGIVLYNLLKFLV